MSFKVVLIIFGIAFSVLAQSTELAGNMNPTQKKTVLTVAIAEVEYHPYNYYDNGKLSGFSVDVLEYFEENSKYDFEFIALSWPRVLRFVELGKVDLVLTLFKNPEREKKYHFIEPAYGNEINQLFTLSDNNFVFSGQLKELTPFSIGTIRKYSYGKAFDQANELNKLPALSEEVLVKLLLNKRLDMIVGNPFVFKKLIREQNKLDVIKAIQPYLAITPVYLALTKKREDADEINTVLSKLSKQLKSSPYYLQLLDKYQLNF